MKQPTQIEEWIALFVYVCVFARYSAPTVGKPLQVVGWCVDMPVLLQSPTQALPTV